MIPKEKIKRAAEKFHYSEEIIDDDVNRDLFDRIFKAGVSFAETELQLFAIKLLHYYRHKPFEFTEGKSNQEVFDMFMAERQSNE